jgi:hypothetical protein
MSDRKLKNNGKGTFFGNLLRGLVKTGKKASPIFDAITGGKVSDILNAIGSSKELTAVEKEMLVKELEQDVIEMQEISKRWDSDMSSDSWLSKNIRPLSLAFLTLSLFLYVILDSSLNSFKIDSQWISLLGNLLMLVYGGYFGARTLEKIRQK